MTTKLKVGFFLLGCSAAWLAMASGQPAATQPNLRSASVSEKTPSLNPADLPPLTRAEALKIITEAKHYVAHPAPRADGKIPEPEVTTPDFDMTEPPPPPLAETQPPAPAAGQVWVPGHYMPVKKEWRWVRGEWAVPATPSSVWIPARYDAKDKKWSPGYWQPDAPALPPAPDSTGKSSAAEAKSNY